MHADFLTAAYAILWILSDGYASEQGQCLTTAPCQQCRYVAIVYAGHIPCTFLVLMIRQSVDTVLLEHAHPVAKALHRIQLDMLLFPAAELERQ